MAIAVAASNTNDANVSPTDLAKEEVVTRGRGSAGRLGARGRVVEPSGAKRRLVGAMSRPLACCATCRAVQWGVVIEHPVDVVWVEPKDPATPVGRENAFGNPASNGLHAHAHPGSSGGQRLVCARSHSLPLP